jgi:pumilio RNA-binding family
LAGHGVKALPRALEIARDEGRKPMLDDAYGSVMEVAMDQYGSRFLQQQLGFAETHEADNVAHEVLSCGGYGSLVRDVFGNYAAQKLLERVSTDNRQRLTSELHGNVVDLALHMYGCRVIQKALDVVSEQEAVELASELEHDVLTCVRDQNGNHVVQKCLERCPLDCVNFMADALTQHVRELARHPYGCRVLQRLLENRPVGFDLGALTVSLVDEAHPLAVDQYGNYVAQHLLEHGSPGERSIVASVVVDDVVHLSQQKFASNVVERCLETCTQEELNNVLAQLVTKPTDFEEPLITLMKDQFGNFVAQKLLDVCNSEQRERLLATMRVHLSVLRRWNYARHIVQRVERLLEAPLQDTSQPMGQTYYKDISNDLDYASRRVSM